MTAENESEYSIALTEKVFSGSGQYCIIFGYTGHVTAENESEKPEFFMPQLSIKELWVNHSCKNVNRNNGNNE